MSAPARARARVDLGAIAHNCRRLRDAVGAGVALGVVVKADGYGHGAVPVARAAQAAGADWLCVAAADEAAELRAAGLEGPVLVMGALTRAERDVALGARADVVAWTSEFLDGLPDGARVHVKLDTGMGRLGTRDPILATSLAERAAAPGGPELAGLMTHFATADEDDETFMNEQLARFRAWADPLHLRWPELLRHAANSAATLRAPAAHGELVRCGIATYGLDPYGRDPAAQGLRPALTLETWVAALKRTRRGESAGYGRRWTAEGETWIATLPIGYGDGLRRAHTNNLDVLIRGRRYPVAGTVSMDNVTVEIGPEPDVAVGDRAVIVGDDGGERILAEELATRIGTINYEITTGLLPRAKRSYEGDEAR